LHPDPIEIEPRQTPSPRSGAAGALLAAALLGAITIATLTLAAEPSTPSIPPSGSSGLSTASPVTLPSGIGGSEGPSLVPGWVSVVDDEFNTPGLPPEWDLYDGPYGSGKRNCAVPSHASVSGGSLQLLMAWESGGKCGPGWYTAGLQVKREFGGIDQRISLRWRLTGTNLQHVRSYINIPMRWDADPNYPWYEGEADYCEGLDLDNCVTYLHYRDPATAIKQPHDVDLTQWHTWTIEHHDNRVRIWVDDQLIWDYQGTTITVPDAFRVTVLQQECPLVGCPSSALAGATETIEVDWIQISNPA
jgi:hypothetical protein